jgi:hypothetical protein
MPQAQSEMALSALNRNGAAHRTYPTPTGFDLVTLQPYFVEA